MEQLYVNKSNITFDDILSKPDPAAEDEKKLLMNMPKPIFPLLPPPPPDPATFTPEKRMFLSILEGYRTSDRFNEFIKKMRFNLSPEYLENLLPSDLKRLETDVSLCIQNRSQSKMFLKYVPQVIALIENPIKDKLGVDISGTGAVLRTDDGFLDAIEEIRIRSFSTTALSPERRVLIKALEYSIMMYNINRTVAATAKNPETAKKIEVIQENVKKDIEKEKEKEKEKEIPPPPKPEPPKPEPPKEVKEEKPENKQESDVPAAFLINYKDVMKK